MITPDFPIALINLAPGDAPAVADTIDIMLYYTYYQDDPDPLVAFNYTKAQAMIDAAKAAGIQVAITCPIATAGMSYDDITPQYLADWGSRVGPFIDAILAYDVDNTVAWWYGPEEARWWYAEREYGACVRLAEELKTRDYRSLPHIAYDAAHYTAPALVPGLIRADGTSTNPFVYTAISDPDTVHPEGVYPMSLTIDRGLADEVTFIRAGLMRGSYMSHTFGDYAHTNRIWSVQLIDSAWEAMSIAGRVVRANNADTGREDTTAYELILHDPDLTSVGGPQLTAPEARHDLWSGLHRATGIALYSYAYAASAPIAWAEYQEGLRFIKKTLRPFFDGERVYPAPLTLTDGAMMPIIPGDDYEVNGGFAGVQFKMPDYPSVNASYLRIAHETYVIVTNSYAHDVQFTVDVGLDIRVVELSIGNNLAEMTFEGSNITDTFYGIDARVYRVLTK